MITIYIPEGEYFDDDANEFITKPSYTLELEHSLVSLSKWESIYEKPYISDAEKTPEEVMAYLYAMIVNPPNVPPDVVKLFTNEDFEKVNTYINAKQTATWFSETQRQPHSREVITSELIYYWMISAGIQKDYETWPLSRLFTLLKVFEHKNSDPKKKKLGADDLARRRELNAQRRAQFGTRG